MKNNLSFEILSLAVAFCAIVQSHLPALSQEESGQSNGTNLPILRPEHSTKDALGYELPSTKGLSVLLGKQPAKPVAPLGNLIATNTDITVSTDDHILNGKHGLLVSIRNRTDRPLIFNGDESFVTSDSAMYSSLPVEAITPRKSPPNDFKGKLNTDLKSTVTAGVTVGAVQTIQDQLRQWSSVPNKYGWDEKRRIGEISRFGKRILWPGDATEGIIYFDSEEAIKGGCVTVPVSSFYDSTDQAALIGFER